MSNKYTFQYHEMFPVLLLEFGENLFTLNVHRYPILIIDKEILYVKIIVNLTKKIVFL